MAHYVYVLRCSNGSFYTGYTIDVKRRLAEHQSGVGSRYTRSRLPVELVYHEKYRTKSLALKREITIKRFSRAMKIRLISGEK